MLTTPFRNVAALVAITASLATVPAHAQTAFPHAFAPQDGLVAPVERASRAELCLNGSWDFQPQALPAGYKQGKDPTPTLAPADAGTWEKTKVKVPSPWNVNAFSDQKGLGGDFRCYPSYPDDWKNVSMGWLKRSFTIPAAWKGKRLLLHFAAVAGDAQVIVNGKVVGQHADIFLPFDVDVTDAVKVGGENTLLVGVRKMSLFDNQGKYGRRTYQGGSMWGQAIAGIWQDVFLEAVPVVHVADVFVRPLVDQGKLEADVTLQNDTDVPAKVSVAGSAYRWISQAGTDVVSAPEPKWKLGADAAIKTAAESTTVPAHGSAIVTLSASAAGKLDAWSPEHPNLYGLVCKVTGASASSDTKYTRFGWRQITFRGADVLLNGQPLIMRGDSWHFLGIPEMTRRYAWAWYKTLKDAHLNAVRLHAEPYPSFFLDVADEQGILVLDEDAIWASDGGPKIDSDAFWNDTEPHLSNLILRDRNHPSVFGWSISNELMAVVRGVFHAPKEYQDKVIQYDGIWAAICRKLDPTRVWISADGEDDAAGQLPDYVVHYGGSDALKRAGNTGKPWGVGEAGPAYYGSPAQIADMAADPRAYMSVADRMEGVAVVSYQSLADQNKYKASYRSVFNLVWYGLKPLELGMTDTTRPPALTDGVFFPPFVEGQPGVQPERLGPYCTTLNPGYDPKLPLYATWPLFDAIKDAAAEPPIEYKPDRQLTYDAGVAKTPTEGAIKSVRVLAGASGTLAKSLDDLGVPVATGDSADPSLVFIDGAQPPSADAKADITKTLDGGGTVFVWGVSAPTLDALNVLLPQPLELTARTASSLAPGIADPLIAGITPASLYYSELSPSTILPAGLGGPLLSRAQTLLTASGTDWMLWNRQAETTKTAMVLRSEREAKPSGIAFAEVKSGKGRILVCNIPAAAQTSQAVALNRALLANLGITLGDATGQRNILNAQGQVTRALGIGRYSAATLEEAASENIVAPNSGPAITVGATVKDRTWAPLSADPSGALTLEALRGVKKDQASVVYFSFWIFSPKALDNLLLDPHLPNLDLTVGAASAVQTWLNSKSAATHPAADGKFVAPTLLLQQGWNHVLVKVSRTPGDTTSGSAGPSLVLSSNQPDYLTQIRGAQEKP